MSDLSLANFLSDFSPRRIADADVIILESDDDEQESFPAESLPLASLEFAPDIDPFADVVGEFQPTDHDIALTEPAADVETRLAEAYAAGQRDGQAKAEAVFEAEKRALLEVHGATLESQRRDLIEGFADRCTSEIREGLNAINQSISSRITTILKPIVSDHLRERAVAAFSEEVSRMTGASSGMDIEIRGPADLLDAFRRREEAHAGTFRLVEADQPELSMRMADAAVETRLAPLLDELNGIAP
ncbi:MAG: hypothetical protein ACRECW_08990 [Phyllobacterium sp.]